MDPKVGCLVSIAYLHLLSPRVSINDFLRASYNGREQFGFRIGLEPTKDGFGFLEYRNRAGKENLGHPVGSGLMVPGWS